MSNLDITALAEQVIADFKQSIFTAVAQDAPAIIAAATAYVTDGEQRLKDLAVNALKSELAYDFVIRRLKEETVTFKDALIGIEQMVAADIQSLVDNLILVFENLLKTVILTISPA